MIFDNCVGDPISDEDIMQRVEKLEAMCDRISKILGVDMVKGAGGTLTSNTSWNNANSLATGAPASSPRSSNLQRSNSMKTRWSKRRDKDNRLVAELRKWRDSYQKTHLSL